MTWPLTTFGAGDLTAFVSRRTLALAEPDHSSTTDVLWRLVAADAPLDEILEVLVGGGLRTLPAFALVRVEATGVRVVVRGAVHATVGRPDGDAAVQTGSVQTWVENFHPDATSVRLHAATAADTDADGTPPRPFDVLAGVVPASWLARDLTADDDPRAADIDAGWGHAEPAPPSDTDATVDVAAPVLAPPALGGAFDEMYSHTVARTVEGAAVREGAADHQPEALAAIAAPIVADDPGEPAPQERGDHDGLTVSRRPSAAGPTSAGALVMAQRCARGHPNPPQGGRCRTCGQALIAAPPVEVPRPALGLLVFSTGERIPVDRPLLIGRNPKLGSGSHGELPRFVRIDAAGQGLSRTHAEVRLDGWQVLLVDSGSSNGTELVLPGHPPRRLAPGDPVALVPGAVVDLGGEVTVAFEAAAP